MFIPSIQWLREKLAPAERPSIATRRRPGLRRLSPDQLGKAINETEKQIITIMLAFLGAAAFCVLSLLTPDSSILGGSDKVNVPLAGPVSFVGFIIIGPAVLVLLRVYLEIYIEHGKRLARVARLVLAKRDPTLLSSQNAFLRIAFALALALLLPLTALLFAWKAAVLPLWGGGVLTMAVAVIVGHAMLALHRFSWKSRGKVIWYVTLFTGVAMLLWDAPKRSYDLISANLSGQWLGHVDLSGADLRGADLSHAVLIDADLSHADLRAANLSAADLSFADLRSADLSHADLSRTDLRGADLRDAKLIGAKQLGAHLSATDLSDAHIFTDSAGNAELRGADLSHADLSGVISLSQAQFDPACGTGAVLPKGLTLKLCPKQAAPTPRFTASQLKLENDH